MVRKLKDSVMVGHEPINEMIMNEIKEFVTKGYKDILLRDPDPNGLDTYSLLIYFKKMGRDGFLGRLRKSREYGIGFDGSGGIFKKNVNIEDTKNEDAKERYNINFFQNFPRYSGYGILGDNIYKTLVKSSYGYNINNIMFQYNTIFNDSNIRHSRISIILSTPVSFFKSRSKITVGYTMFEANKIPMSWVPNCNIVDRIFVPIESNIDAFRSCGVNVPIDVIPIGIDANIYDPSKINDIFNFENDKINDAYKFLIINDGQVRKNNQMIMDAFHQEFNEEIEKKEVYLIIRSHNPYKGRNIFWVNRYLEDDEMPVLINSCNCMINIASGECGDIPILEGMAMERPVIVSDDHLLHSEIIEEEKTGFLVDIEKWESAFLHPVYKSEPYLIGLKAEWIVPSIESLKKKMRYVYDNREIAKNVGRNARQYVLQNRTIDMSIQKMVDIFKTF